MNHLLEQEQKKEIQPVYNGTGVILHTGLGRATLSHEIAEKLKAVAENYSSLEYDLQTGKRGNMQKNCFVRSREQKRQLL